MNLEPLTQSEVSQKEKNKDCILAHLIWNLDSWYCRLYVQGRSGGADTGTRLGDSAVGGSAGWDQRKEGHTSPRVRQTARGLAL